MSDIDVNELRRQVIAVLSDPVGMSGVWIMGSPTSDTGVFRMNDGTLIAKEYQSVGGGGVNRTLRMLRGPDHKRGEP